VDNHILEQIPLYLDDELLDDERLAIETHVKNCLDCRAALEHERELGSAIRNARPNLTAPAPLRKKVGRLLQDSRSRPAVSLSRPMLATCALLLLAVPVILWLAVTKYPRAERSSFVTVAVDNHVRYLKGQLPLEVFSDSPEQIAAWFAGKLAFNLRLPDYPEQSAENKPYHVEGGRLVGFKEDYAAYIVYRLNGHPISLVVTSNSIAQPSGGEEIPWERLRFHFQTMSGWKVLTWSHNGLTYALVSNLQERGQASCIVCHQDERVLRGLQSFRKSM
jgi:anti-sigma factor RsiW